MHLCELYRSPAVTLPRASCVLVTFNLDFHQIPCANYRLGQMSLIPDLDLCASPGFDVAVLKPTYEYLQVPGNCM